MGESILVDGAEHYSGDLSQFSCAGALITHPVTGGLLGVIDITTESIHSNSLLLSFAKLAAQRIRERILEDASALDKALLGDYHRACQHSGGAVIALGGEVFIMNALMQRHFDAADQAALIDQTRDARGRMSPFTTLADLPSGLTARFSYQPSFVDETLAGGIVQIKEHRTRLVAPPRSQPLALPGVAGSSARWQHTVDQVVEACSRGEWVILEGEASVGKQLLLGAAHQRCAPNRRLVIVDAAGSSGDGDAIDQAAAALQDGADLVVRHAHLLASEELDRLADLLQTDHDDMGTQSPWVALTVLESAETEQWGTSVVGFFPRTVTVPPLRHHLEDLPALVHLMLKQSGAAELTLSREAMSQLMRLPWAGNVGHLRQTLAHVSHRRRSGEAGVEDLPAECHSTARRQLTAMEAMQRDAIVAELAIHGGDKDAAAAGLGMSRATIYRRIREFGIQS